MKHQDPRELQQSAEAIPQQPLSIDQRLERWADLLERHPGPVHALDRIEYMLPKDRRAVRGVNSPMAVAYGDVVLREQGLAGDTLGDAMAFFDLSDEDAHRMFCDCHYHGTMSGDSLAARMRGHVRRRQNGSIWERARRAVANRVVLG